MTLRLWHPDLDEVRGRAGVPRCWPWLAQCLPLRGLFAWAARCAFGLRVRGFEHVPRDRACVFVANHGSHYDGFFLFAAISHEDPRGLVPVAWDGLLDYPILGGLLRSVQAVPVAYQNAAGMGRMDNIRAMIGHLQAGRHVVVQPEGRRDDRLGPFHPGAAAAALGAGAPLVPVTLRGVQPLFKELGHMPRLHGRVELVFHPPLFPAGEAAEAPVWMRRARERVASALDYPDALA